MENDITGEIIKKDFPIFENHHISYLDSAATTQKPQYVLDKIQEYYKNANANPHRGAYKLSTKATTVYDESKYKVAKFINAKSAAEIIYTKNATEALNLVAYSYGMNYIKENDKIVVSIMEHHSNIVPWQNVAKSKKANLEYLYLNDDFIIDDNEINKKIDENTRIVSIAQVSNVLGTINPIERIIRRAHEVGAIVVVDCAQSIPHMKVDVQELDADLIAFSGHKMLSPMGIGVLYGKLELLNKMKPFLSGGDMIEYVYEQNTTFAELPYKFEAGTQNVEGAVGLTAAIEYLEKIGMDQVERIEKELLEYATSKMKELDFIQMYGTNDISKKAGVIAFNIKGVHAHDVSTILDNLDIAIRTGSHCAQPLHRYIGVDATCRVSFYIYNTKEDVDKLIAGLIQVNSMFSKWNKS